MVRQLDGRLHRFDSVTELLAFCRARYPTDKVRTTNTQDEFVLLIGDRLESLIVHFEGSRCYAVMLPPAETG